MTERQTSRRFNAVLEAMGEKITTAVGTMWAAIIFSILAFISLPGAIASGSPVVIVAWIAQTFLQLVLLPIIMVGQDVQSRKTEKRDVETHRAVMAAHRETQEILRELHAGALASKVAPKVGKPAARPSARKPQRDS